MDDATALRLKKIELGLESTRRTAEMQSHRALAILAMAATFGTTTGLAALARALPSSFAAVCFVASTVVMVVQFRTLKRLTREVDEATTEAMAAIDSLISAGGESSADGQADAGGA